MAATTLYCSRDDLKRWLSDAGVVVVADDDADGSANENELGALDRAILSAGAEIDAALVLTFNVVPLPQDDGSRNQWLKDRCIELAAEYVVSRRGSKVPKSIADRAARTREWLERVLSGEMRVPGLVYPIDQDDQIQRQMGLPRIVNPCDTPASIANRQYRGW